LPARCVHEVALVVVGDVTRVLFRRSEDARADLGVLSEVDVGTSLTVFLLADDSIEDGPGECVWVGMGGW
jgi:hypothetical protein